jgi:hypothetical protein
MAQSLQHLTKIITDIDKSYETESITDLEIAIATLDELFEDQSQDVAKKIDRLLDSFETCLAEHPNVSFENTKNSLFLYNIVENLHQSQLFFVFACLHYLLTSSQQGIGIGEKSGDNFRNSPN